MRHQFDAIVIGGGSAGLAFAKSAAGHGARVALIERGPLGGTCVNRGCVPKKLLWKAARGLRRTAEMEAAGLTAATALDFQRLQRRIGARMEELRAGYAGELDGAGITVLRGEAEVDAPGKVRFAGETLECDRLVLATGARPSDLDIDGAEHLVTSDEVLAWRELPRRLVILGAGYIGCEFASIFAAMGTEVTLVEPAGQVLTGFDPCLSEAACTALDRQGVARIMESKPLSVAQVGDGHVIALEADGELRADSVVNATGRTPNVDTFGALRDRLELAGSGALAVDARLETSVPGVHAVGDVADRLPLTPVATRDGAALGDMLFGGGGTLAPLDCVSRSAFLIPPMAQVGQPGGETQHGATLGDGVLGNSGCDTTMHRTGFDEDGRFTGIAVAGEDAPEIVGVFAALVAAGASRAQIAAATAVHPSFAEEMIGPGT